MKILELLFRAQRRFSTSPACYPRKSWHVFSSRKKLMGLGKGFGRLSPAKCVNVRVRAGFFYRAGLKKR